MDEELLDGLAKLLAEEVGSLMDCRVKADDFGTRKIARRVLEYLPSITTARANTIEEVAAWYADKGFFMDEDNVPDAIRAIAGGKE